MYYVYSFNSPMTFMAPGNVNLFLGVITKQLRQMSQYSLFNGRNHTHNKTGSPTIFIKKTTLKESLP